MNLPTKKRLNFGSHQLSQINKCKCISILNLWASWKKSPSLKLFNHARCTKNWAHQKKRLWLTFFNVIAWLTMNWNMYNYVPTMHNCTFFFGKVMSNLILLLFYGPVTIVRYNWMVRVLHKIILLLNLHI